MSQHTQLIREGTCKRKKHCLNEVTNDSCLLKKKSRNRFWKISSIQWEFTGFQKQNYEVFIQSCLFSSVSAAYLLIFSEELTESRGKIWEMNLGGITEGPWSPCTSKCIRKSSGAFLQKLHLKYGMHTICPVFSYFRKKKTLLK